MCASIATAQDANSRLFFSPPGMAPCRAYSSAPGRKWTLVDLDLESDAAADRHLARMADQAEAGDVGAAVHVEAQHRLAGAAIQRQHRLDRRLDVLIRRRCRASARCAITPVPMRLVKTSASPARAPALALRASGWTVPVTA